MDTAKLAELLQTVGLGDYVDAILSYAKPCIRLHASRADNPDGLSLGSSRIGGLPDLPPNTNWPTRNGRPCEFIAQISLSDATQYDETGLLPKEGLVLFFFDGRDYEDAVYQRYQKGSETIIFYTGDILALEQAKTYPDLLEKWQRYRECTITFGVDWMLPNWPAAASFVLEQSVLNATGFEQYGEETPQVKAYREMTKDLEPYKDGDKHHLLGHPEPVIQDDPLFELPGVWEGGHLDKEALAEWILFLQISSDFGPGMLWGDTSSLYYCIRKDDLIARRFENAICIEHNC